MTEPAEWKLKIEAAMANRSAPIRAHSYRNKKWSTYSKPVVLGCDDGKDYVVKGAQVGRAICNEQIVSYLGRLIGAPVADVALVDVPAELIQLQAELSHLRAGVAHGSLLVTDCSERHWVNHVDVPDNRLRFAALAILYGLIPANDHQLVYRNQSPFMVYSVDHGHFFPGGPHWTEASIAGASPPQTYQTLVNDCKLTRDELITAAGQLEALNDDEIANAVAIPHETWGLSIDERVTVSNYLSLRVSHLAASLAHN